MIKIDDPHGSLARWRLSLSTIDFTVVYRPGLNYEVPDALYRCGAASGEAVEVKHYFPCFGDVTLAATRHQANPFTDRTNETGRSNENEVEPP